MTANIGTEGRKYTPYVFSLFMFILFCNLLGMLPLGVLGVHPFTVTSHIAITGVLALLSFSIVLVVGFWRQVADATRPDGSTYEVHGIGGSWFRYAGDYQWNWQRDWFDFGNAAHLFLEMMSAGVLSEGMTARMNRSMRGPLPGYYPAGTSPVKIWER